MGAAAARAGQRHRTLFDASSTPAHGNDPCQPVGAAIPWLSSSSCPRLFLSHSTRGWERTVPHRVLSADLGNAAFWNILSPELLSQLVAERCRDITQQSGEPPPACEERKSPQSVFHSLSARPWKATADPGSHWRLLCTAQNFPSSLFIRDCFKIP